MITGATSNRPIASGNFFLLILSIRSFLWFIIFVAKKTERKTKY